MRKFNIVFLTALSISLFSCATPDLNALRAIKPNEQFEVLADLSCLYNKGVERVSSYLGMTEPKFTWFVDVEKQYAWFRQPHTLVELKAKSNSVTEISRSQTALATGFHQGDDLIKFLKLNPCEVKQ